METINVLKAMSDDTRMKILKMLLEYNYCVRAIARKLNLSEATVSQHLKILRESGLLEREKRGYFIHYTVNTELLKQVSDEILALTKIEKKICSPVRGGCTPSENVRCHIAKDNEPDEKRCCRRQRRCRCKNQNVNEDLGGIINEDSNNI